MIEAYDVHVSEQSAQPVNAPAIARPPEAFPIVNRIAPELPLRAEVIGRHAGDEACPALLIQKEELRISPYIARVGRNEERKIADQSHAPGMRMYLEPLALAEQKKLPKAHLADLILQFVSDFLQRRRLAPH